MAKSKKTSSTPKGSPQPKSNLNSVELTNLLKPFRDIQTNTYYLTNEIKDETGKVVRIESVAQDSESGQLLIKATVSEMLRDAFTANDMPHANEVLKGTAIRRAPHEPVNPVEAPPQPEPIKEDRRKTRPTFPAFMQAVSAEGVMAAVDVQGNIRIELPGDPENGLPEDWDANSKRVRAWLFRFYLLTYGVRPDAGELRDAVEWLRSEAYFWGQGEPTGRAAANALDDDAVYVAVREYCKDLRRVGDTLSERGSKAFDDLKLKAKDAGADLKKWPERPSDLSGKLKKSQELLTSLGLAFTTVHTRTGSYWIFERSEVPVHVTTGKILVPSEGEEDDMSA